MEKAHVLTVPATCFGDCGEGYLRICCTKSIDVLKEAFDRLEQVKELADQAVEYIPKRVKYYAEKENFVYNKITIKNLVSRWGSCSTKGNLNFNCLLMLTPDYVIDYIVVHELCHLREMNHSEKFWAEVEKIMPDYQRAELWLKQNGGNLISRIRG